MKWNEIGLKYSLKISVSTILHKDICQSRDQDFEYKHLCIDRSRANCPHMIYSASKSSTQVSAKLLSYDSFNLHLAEVISTVSIQFPPKSC